MFKSTHDWILSKRYILRHGLKHVRSQLLNFERCFPRTVLAEHLFLLIECQYTWRYYHGLKMARLFKVAASQRQIFELSC